jgi:NTP pyrophosphatase (non-canonical NTP hydrolase)
MSDSVTTIATLKDAVRRFAAERDWEPFHSPKNLVMALAIETAELMEHFLWIDAEASRRTVADPAKRQAIADELADVACVLLNLSLNTGIDLADAIRSKMERNALKYPPPNRSEAN